MFLVIEMTQVELLTFNKLYLACDAQDFRPVIKDAIRLLLQNINYLICSSTDVCYHPNSMVQKEDVYYVPITIQYHNEDGDVADIVDARVKSVQQMIRTMKYDKKPLQFAARILNTYEVDPFNIFILIYSLDDGTELITAPIELRLPSVPMPTIQEHQYRSGQFRHLEYIDPLMLDYGLYVGLSKPFEDMGYYYNALHIYEHMMTTCWRNLSKEDLIELNGATFPTASCYLYNIHKTKQSLKQYVREYVKFHLKTRDKHFWDTTLQPALKRETIRTYSETQDIRDVKEFARTDPSVYPDMMYNTDIFTKFSQDQFTILTVAPEHIDFKFDDIIEKTDVDMTRVHISPRKYNMIPLAAIRNSREFVVIPYDTYDEHIVDANSCIVGEDCIGVQLGDESHEIESLNAMVLLILRHTIEAIHDFLRMRVLPIDNKTFANVDIFYSMTGYCNWLEGCECV